MKNRLLYVYAIGAPLESGGIPEGLEAIDGSDRIEQLQESNLSALFTEVDEQSFGQEEIDRRATDLDWLGVIGYRHDGVIHGLASKSAVIPLRAFTLFKSRDSLREFLRGDAERLGGILDRLKGKDEWTVRVEFDAETWSRALVRRVDSLRTLMEEIERAPEGKAYLLKKRLDEQRKSAARDAENDLIGEIEEGLATGLGTPVLTETRQMKEGSFPQINILLDRGREDELQKLLETLQDRNASSGVSLRLSGPWPPYTFASGDIHG